MINLSELRVVEDTFFKTDLTYYKPSIYKLIERHFNEENDYGEATLVKLRNIAKGYQNMAFNQILKEDAKKLAKEIKKSPKQFDEQLWRDMLPKIRNEVKKTLGLDFKTRSIFFEEHFPPGLIMFEKKGASSVTVFEGQTNAGIYFLNKRVSSFFTPIFLIHEQLHSCLSQNKNKDQIYIEWFEEGLCQWYSLKIYFNLTKNKDVLNLYKQRALIYSKVKDEHNYTKRYFEYMKIFARLFSHGGEKFIGKVLIEYLSNNRDKVNSYLDLNNLTPKYLPDKFIEDFLMNFAFQLEPEKLPPIEYLILRETVKPKSFDEIAKKVKAPDMLVKQALIALQMKGMVVAKDNIEINWRKMDVFETLIKPFWPLK